MPFSVCCEWNLKLTFGYCVFRLLFLALCVSKEFGLSVQILGFFIVCFLKNRSSAIVYHFDFYSLFCFQKLDTYHVCGAMWHEAIWFVIEIVLSSSIDGSLKERA